MTYFKDTRDLNSFEEELTKILDTKGPAPQPVTKQDMEVYKKLVMQFNTLMEDAAEVNAEQATRILGKITDIFHDTNSAAALAVLLPTLFKMNSVAAATLVAVNPLAQAQARLLPVAITGPFAAPDNIDSQRYSSFYDRIKQTAQEISRWESETGLTFDPSLSLEEHRNANPSIFEQRLTAWVGRAGPGEDREEAARRIRNVCNGVPNSLDRGGQRYLDLTGLGLNSIPEVVCALNIKRIDVNNTAVLEKPEALKHAPHRRTVLALIEVNHSLFEHIHSDLKNDMNFIFDAVKKNPAVLQLLPSTIRNDMAFLMKAAEEGIGILPYVSEELKRDVDFMRKLLDAYSFGKEKWEKFFGPIGEVPPVPAEMMMILCGPDPYDDYVPRRTVAENYMLFLRPATVNGQPLTLNNFKPLADAQLTHLNSDSFAELFIWQNIMDQHGNKTPEGGSQWMLLRKDVIPGTRGRPFEEQQDRVNSQPDYSLPDELSITVGAIAHYLRSDECLFGQCPWTCTRCLESNGMYRAVIFGDFAQEGVSLAWDYDDPRDKRVGVTAQRNFPYVQARSSASQNDSLWNRITKKK